MSVINETNLDELINNPNVLSIKKKHIVYTDDFKIRAIEEVDNGKPASLVWEENGFSLIDFRRKYFNQCINRCNRNFYRPLK